MCSPDAARARRALRCLDLTDLSETCSDHAIDDLCAKALTPHGPVAAVCVWPQFVSRARDALKGTPVRIATVVNFPSGAEDIDRVIDDAHGALDDGAQEIDLVLPYRAVRRGDLDRAAAHGRGRARRRRSRRLLKVILETGELVEPALIETREPDRHRGRRRLHQDLDRQDRGLGDAGGRRDHAGGHQGFRATGRPQALRRHPHARGRRGLS